MMQELKELGFSIAHRRVGRGVQTKKGSNTMKTSTTSPLALATDPSGPSLFGEAFEALAESFAQFCLMAGIESLTQMMGCDATRLAGDSLASRLRRAWRAKPSTTIGSTKR